MPQPAINSRRKFLTQLAGIPLAFNALPFGGQRLLNLLSSDPSERVLLLIQLNGGNDGLNTFIPVDQYAHLARNRPNVLLPEQRLLRLTDTQAFHPAFSGALALYDHAELAILQDIGYPDHNRSHFRSLDIYNTSSSAADVYTTGWLGRYMDSLHPGFPDRYPSSQYPDPVAIALGNTISETCQGTAANFAMAVSNPFRLTNLLDADVDADARYPRHTEELAFLQDNIAQTNGYAVSVKNAAERGRSLANYPDTPFGQQLSHVARLISGGLQTKVYVVTLGGFDTHAAQVDAQSHELGVHAQLLRELGDGIRAFQEDVRALGVQERVLGLTYSEFGRRIRSNAALGTDHGTASPCFVFGECVVAGVLGRNPTIPLEADVDEGVPMQLDFRNVHGTVLEDWFGVAAADVRSLLFADYTRLPFLRNCGASGVSDDQGFGDSRMTLAPNPFGTETQLTLELRRADTVRITVHDATGRLVERLNAGGLAAGQHRLQVDTSGYAPGAHFFRLEAGGLGEVARGIRL